jgi:hypothetical protein
MEGRSVKKLIRSARGAVIAVVLALVVAAPAAAAQPTRTVTHFSAGATHFPAGTGCEFDVTAYRTDNSFSIITDFSDGREMGIFHSSRRTIVNDATGATFVETTANREVDRFDTDAGVIRGSVTGQSIFQFAVGDVAPDGSIVDHVYAIFIRGKVSYVIDDTTFATLAISVEGTYTDICAAIS